MTERERGRVAIYFSPPAESSLYRFGSACLGRDAVTGAAQPHPPIDGISSDRWYAITASPRSYGFHATLKPPFHLAAGRTRDELVRQLDRFATTWCPFDTSPLRVDRIANFVAMVPQEASMVLSALADACVRHFDAFRAPAAPDDLARRSAASLTPRQRELLATWGYPYVLEEWRFHLTLATSLARPEADHLRDALGRLAAPLCQAPLRVDDICLFEQARSDAPFTLTARFPFGGSPES